MIPNGVMVGLIGASVAVIVTAMLWPRTGLQPPAAVLGWVWTVTLLTAGGQLPLAAAVTLVATYLTIGACTEYPAGVPPLLPPDDPDARS